MSVQWGGLGKFNPYGTNLDLGVNYDPGAWNFNSEANYFKTPISDSTMDAMKGSFYYGSTPGAGAASAASNAFGGLGSAIGKMGSAFGGAGAMPPSTNMGAWMAAMGGLTAYRDSQERQANFGWQKLSNDMANRLSADKWFKYGPHFEQQAQNLAQRGAISDNLMADSQTAKDIRNNLNGYGHAPRLANLGLGTLPYG